MKGCYFTTGFFLLLRLIYFCHSIIFLQYLSNILNSTTEKFTDNSHILSIQSDDFLNKFTQLCNFHHNPVLKYLCHPKHFLKSLCSQPQLQLPTQGKQRFFFFFCRARGLWKFLGQWSNVCHSSYQSCYSDNIRSLIQCATRELQT